ncbi:hypothetical protein DE146DRAFT_230864 [Phaeosphaeria sp. MPI-PUGE-AT-0046c]|nr:hypothetical protein DE146DRAFT_230864 [Phaeosphaeria sp. MPI-PUGE-AT-0046c]
MSYGGDEDRRAFALTINWVFTSISLCESCLNLFGTTPPYLRTAAVTLRLASRKLLERSNWEIDDGMIIFAMAVILTRTIWLTVNVSMGFGRHVVELVAEDPVNATQLARSAYGLTALSLWTFVLPKIPVVALLVRLFRTHSNKFSRILWSMLGFLLCWNFVMTIITFVKCDPVEKNWQPRRPGKCWDPRIYLYMGYFSGAYSAFLDFVYAIFPMVRTSQLQMEKSRKILILVSFSLGIPAGIVSAYKTSTIAALISEGDPTFATIPVEAWNGVESTALMLAATVPMTKPIMAWGFKRIKSLTSYLSARTSGTSRGTPGSSKASSNPEARPPSDRYQKYSSNDDILLETRLSDNSLQSSRV